MKKLQTTKQNQNQNQNQTRKRRRRKETVDKETKDEGEEKKPDGDDEDQQGLYEFRTPQDVIRISCPDRLTPRFQCTSS